MSIPNGYATLLERTIMMEAIERNARIMICLSHLLNWQKLYLSFWYQVPCTNTCLAGKLHGWKRNFHNLCHLRLEISPRTGARKHPPTVNACQAFDKCGLC